MESRKRFKRYSGKKWLKAKMKPGIKKKRKNGLNRKRNKEQLWEPLANMNFKFFQVTELSAETRDFHCKIKIFLFPIEFIFSCIAIICIKCILE